MTASNNDSMRERSAYEIVEDARARLMDANRSKAVQRQHALGKLTARERIDALADPGTFREIGALVRPDRRYPDVRSDDAHADGVVVGSPTVNGRTIGVLSFDFTVLGGSNGTVGGEKADRQARLCLELGGPAIQADREGIADIVAADDKSALQIVRDFLGYFPTTLANPSRSPAVPIRRTGVPKSSRSSCRPTRGAPATYAQLSTRSPTTVAFSRLSRGSRAMSLPG